MTWSRRERRWWIASLAFVLLIYLSLYFVRFPVEYLRERNLLRVAVAALFGAVVIPLIMALVRRGIGAREGAVLAVAAGIFVWLVGLTPRPEEKLHFLEYGLLAGMLYAAARERAARLGRSGAGALLVPGATAAVLAALAGWGDELIQAILPNRVYDVRDILWNALGGSVAAAALVAAAYARRRDRPG